MKLARLARTLARLAAIASMLASESSQDMNLSQSGFENNIWLSMYSNVLKVRDARMV